MSCKYYSSLFVFSLLGCEGMGKDENKISPNVVFILVDDLGWADLGYTGSKFYETPNIEKPAIPYRINIVVDNFYCILQK